MLRSIGSAVGILIAVSTTMVCAPDVSARKWTDRTGNFTLEAELVTVRAGNAYLEDSSGAVKKVPLEKLSVSDLKHLASLPEHRDEANRYLPEEARKASKTSKNKFAVIETHLDSGSVRQFRSPSWGYDGIVFSSDGAYLLALGSDNITVCDINASKTSIQSIQRGIDSRSALAMTPDGKRLFAGTSDGEVLVWSFERGELTAEDRFGIRADDEVVSISISPDGKRGVTTHNDNVACLWDVENGNVVGSYSDFYFGSNAATRFSQRGGQALITDGGVAALVDVKSAKLLQVMGLCEYPASVHSSAILHDGTQIAACEGRAINVWQTRSGKRLPEIPTDDIQWSAAFTNNGKYLATGGSGVVSLWDLKRGKLGHQFELQDSGYVQHVAVSPDGIHIAAIGGPIGQLVEVLRLPSDFID